MSDGKAPSWFYPKPTGDPGRDRNARTLQFACFLLFLTVGTVATLNTLERETHQTPLLVAAAVGLIVAAFVNRAGKAAWAARTAFLSLLFTAALLVFEARDGFRSHAMLVFPALLLLSVMFLDRVSYVITAVLVLLTVTALGIGELHGIGRGVPPRGTPISYDTIFYVDFALLVFALIGSRIARDHQSNVAELRTIVDRMSAANLALSEGDRRLRIAKDAAKLGIYEYDIASGTILWDARVRQFWGVGPDAPITIETFFEGLHPEDRPKTQAILDRSLDPAGTGEYYAEYRVISRADGSERWVAASGQVSFKSGRPVSMIGTGQDISERKRTEAELRESEERFRNVADTAPVMIWVTGPDKLFTFVNRTWLNFTGRALEQELGRGWASVHPEDFERCYEAFSSAFSERRNFHSECRLRRADGEYRSILCSGIPRFAPGGTFAGYIGSAIDVTDLQSEQRFRQLAENIDQVFWMLDIRDDRVLYVSPAFEKVWGVSPAARYQNPAWLLDTVHTDDRERCVAFLARRKSEPAEETYRIVRPDGSVRWICDRAFLVSDPDGKPYRVAGIAEDITAQRELEEGLRQAQKMEAIGRLAGGIAHDFNNLLTVVLGYLHLILDTTPPSDPNHDKLNQILGASNRASALTSQLLAFGRKQMVQPRLVNVNSLLTGMQGLLRPVMGEHIRLEIYLADDIPCVKADPNQLEQVLMNLAANARDAMPEGGEFRIRTARAEAQAGTLIQISDTGCGMSRNVLEHIFEPFFTTKGIGKGTGLGLSMVYGIVQQNHGTIHVASSPGRGTTFEIVLPAASEGERARPAAAPFESLRGTETILVAEDEEGVRNLVCETLEQLGYTVLQAADGREALRVLEQHGPIQLLLTDVIMPVMGGPELAKRAASLAPGTKVMYMSGYTDDMLAPYGLPQPGPAYIQKPFTPSALAEKVRQALPPAGPTGQRHARGEAGSG
jgi:PAS domain S-box-containing protein